jgi:hypothetical protein
MEKKSASPQVIEALEKLINTSQLAITAPTRLQSVTNPLLC